MRKRRPAPFTLTVSYLDEVAHIVKNDNGFAYFIWQIAVELRRQRDEVLEQRRTLEEKLREVSRVAAEADAIAWHHQNSDRYPMPDRMKEC